jgi:hypothetical protein
MHHSLWHTPTQFQPTVPATRSPVILRFLAPLLPSLIRPVLRVVGLQFRSISWAVWFPRHGLGEVVFKWEGAMAEIRFKVASTHSKWHPELLDAISMLSRKSRVCVIPHPARSRCPSPHHTRVCVGGPVCCTRKEETAHCRSKKVDSFLIHHHGPSVFLLLTSIQ